MAVVPTSSIRSVNFQDRFIRHAQFLGELTTIESDLDRKDATFFIDRGLKDPDRAGRVSFRSLNFSGHFLRHEDFRIKLHEQDLTFPGPADPSNPASGAGVLSPDEVAKRELFRQDATFVQEDGLAGTGVSFRSFNFPTRHLRHRDFHLYVEEIDLSSDIAKQDASFEIVHGFVRGPASPK